MILKPLLGISLGAVFGAAIGHSQLLCPDGQCAITGSWYGGAMFGGIMGMAVIGAIGQGKTADPSAGPEEPDEVDAPR